MCTYATIKTPAQELVAAIDAALQSAPAALTA
jgi:hypothetical protein